MDLHRLFAGQRIYLLLVSVACDQTLPSSMHHFRVCTQRRLQISIAAWTSKNTKTSAGINQDSVTEIVPIDRAAARVRRTDSDWTNRMSASPKLTQFYLLTGQTLKISQADAVCHRRHSCCSCRRAAGSICRQRAFGGYRGRRRH